MWPYFVMFLIPALAALKERQRPLGLVTSQHMIRLTGSWLLIALALTVLVGLRFEVGGDWGNYLKNLDEAAYRDFADSASWSDPGYRLIEWLAVQLDWGITGVNLACAVFFSFGLVVFCRSLPRPWLGLAVAVPYLVIIVGMGYTRQGIAIGCAMVGLVALGRQRIAPFLVWVLIAATFHKSAVLLMPIAALAATKRRGWSAFWVVVITSLAYVLMLQDSVDALRTNYLEAEYASEGALVRLLMNALPAALFLIYRRRFAMTRPQVALWTWFSIISFGLLAVYFVSPSSTAVDRVALYVLPLQLVVFSFLPEVWSRPRSPQNRVFVLGVLLYYAVVELVWLNFANNASYWLPYRLYFTELL